MNKLNKSNFLREYIGWFFKPVSGKNVNPIRVVYLIFLISIPSCALDNYNTPSLSIDNYKFKSIHHSGSIESIVDGKGFLGLSLSTDSGDNLYAKLVDYGENYKKIKSILDVKSEVIFDVYYLKSKYGLVFSENKIISLEISDRAIYKIDFERYSDTRKIKNILFKILLILFGTFIFCRWLICRNRC